MQHKKFKTKRCEGIRHLLFNWINYQLGKEMQHTPALGRKEVDEIIRCINSPYKDTVTGSFLGSLWT